MGGDRGSDLRGRPTPWLLTLGGARARLWRRRSPRSPVAQGSARRAGRWREAPSAAFKAWAPPTPSPTPWRGPAPSCICRCAGDEWANELSVSSRTCWLRAPGARARRAEAGTRRRRRREGGREPGRSAAACEPEPEPEARAAPPRPRPPPPLPALGGRAGAGRPGRARRGGGGGVRQRCGRGAGGACPGGCFCCWRCACR